VFTLQGSTHILGVPRHLLQYPYHAGAFFGLAFLMFRCFASRPVGWSPRRAAVSAWLGSALVSLLSEVIQFNVPGRSFTVKDLLLDLTGATAAVVLARAKRAAFQRG
jgi:VanZ family protein